MGRSIRRSCCARCSLREGQPRAARAAALAEIQARVRGEVAVLPVPVHYQRSAAQLTVTGEGPLKQSELGLKPFSALLGALQVQDEMRVSFRIVAHAAARPLAAPAHPTTG